VLNASILAEHGFLGVDVKLPGVLAIEQLLATVLILADASNKMS
jgi:hypothetical protein